MHFSSRNPFAPWNVYASQLVHFGYGHPLWCPDPVNKDGSDEIQIGDVGFLNEGRFIRLFNACRDEDDPLNQYGVPEGFEVLKVHPNLRRQETNFLPVGPLCSKSTVSKESELQVDGSLLPGTPIGGGGGYSFSIEGKRGAVALLKDDGIQERILPCLPFEEYILCHHLSWYAFAARLGHSLRADDIVLVSGWVKTSKWALFAYADETRSHTLSLSISSNGMASAHGNLSMTQNIAIPKATKCGPKSDGLDQLVGTSPSSTPSCETILPRKDQCLFLRYYKCRRRGLGVVTIGQNAPARFAEEDVPATCHCLPCSGLFGLRRRGQNRRFDKEKNRMPDVIVDENPPRGPEDPAMEETLRYMQQHTDAETVIASHDYLDAIFNSEPQTPSQIRSLLAEQRPHVAKFPQGNAAFLDVVTRYDHEGRPTPCTHANGVDTDSDTAVNSSETDHKTSLGSHSSHATPLACPSPPKPPDVTPSSAMPALEVAAHTSHVRENDTDLLVAAAASGCDIGAEESVADSSELVVHTAGYQDIHRQREVAYFDPRLESHLGDDVDDDDFPHLHSYAPFTQRAAPNEDMQEEMLNSESPALDAYRRRLPRHAQDMPPLPTIDSLAINRPWLSRPASLGFDSTTADDSSLGETLWSEVDSVYSRGIEYPFGPGERYWGRSGDPGAYSPSENDSVEDEWHRRLPSGKPMVARSASLSSHGTFDLPSIVSETLLGPTRQRTATVRPDATADTSPINSNGNAGSSRAWQTLQGLSDTYDYSQQHRQLREQKNSCEGYGKIFVKVRGIQLHNLPIPSQTTHVTCTLNNGIHYVTTPECVLGAETRIDQEFELIEYNKLEFTLTIKVRRDPHIAAQIQAIMPPRTSIARPPAVRHASLSDFRRLLNESSKKLPKAVASSPPPPVEPLPENLARYLKPDCTLASAFVPVEDIVELCDTKLLETSYPLTGQKMEPGSAPTTLQVGEITLHIFRLPPLPGIPSDQLPQSLEQCHQGLWNAQWHKMTYIEGTLSQKGGGCTSWCRRYFRLVGATMLADYDGTKEAATSIDLQEVLAVEDDEVIPHELPTSPGSHSSGRSSPHVESDMRQGVDRAFRLIFPDDQEIIFVADTDGEKAKWLDILRAIVGRIPPSPLWAELVWQRQRWQENGQIRSMSM